MQMDSLAARLRLLTWLAALLVLAVPLLTARGAAGATAVQAAALAASLPPFLLVAWGMLQLSGFCRHLAEGDHFSLSAAQALRRFGRALVAAAVLLVPCRVVALLLELGSGWMGSAQLWRPGTLLAAALGAVIGLIVIVFARILEEAAELAEENASFL